MMISATIPVFNSEPSLEEIWHRLTGVFIDLGLEFEIIMVDDASRDNSFSIMQKLRAQDRRIKIIRLAYNAGQHNATLCGLSYCRGDYIVTIDDDLEQRPEEIPALLAQLNKGCDVVFGIPRRKTKGSLRIWSSRLIDICINWIFPQARSLKRSSYRIMTRDLVDRILLNYRPPLYMGALILSCAVQPCSLEVENATRKHGRSNYTLAKNLGLARNLLINYSYIPVKILLGFWALFVPLSVIWLQPHASSAPGEADPAVIIWGVATAAMVLLSSWIVWAYWQRSRRQKSTPVPPYVIQDLETDGA